MTEENKIDLELEELEQDEKKDDDHEVIEATEDTLKDIKDEDITDEMIDEFTKSKGKTLKIKKEKIAQKTVEPKAQKEEKVVEPVKEEVKAAPKAEEKPPVSTPEPQKVDLRALQEERAWRRDLQKKIQELEAKLNPPAPKVTYEEDPLEYIKTNLEEVKQRQEQYVTQHSQQTEEQQFFNAYTGAAKEFATQKNDFQPAYNHLWESRYKELQSYGFSPEEAQQTIQQEEMWLVRAAFAKGLNPAAQLYKLAEARGYKQAVAQPEVQQHPSASDKINMIKQGQDLNKSLKGGRSSGNDLTDEVIDDIDNINPFDDLNKATALDVFFAKAKKNSRKN